MSKRRRPIVTSGYVERGKVQWDNPTLAMAPLKAWDGERVTVTIAQEHQARSQRANAYLWGVVYKLMAEESGYSADDLHELMKLRHNSKLVVEPGSGEEVKIGQSTSKLSVEEFGVFIERVMVDGAEWLGVSIPPPRAHEDYRERVA